MKLYIILISALLTLPFYVYANTAAPIKKVRDITIQNITYQQANLTWHYKQSKHYQFDVWLKNTNNSTSERYTTNTPYIPLTNLEPETNYLVKIRAHTNTNQVGRWSIAKFFTTSKTPAITTIFGGDVMLSRYVGRVTANTGDYTLPFQNIAAEFKQADLAFINLEAPFKETGSYYVADSAMSFKVDPKFITGLQSAGIDITSLANNHIGNAGVASIDFTKQYLSDNNIAYCLEHYDIRIVHDKKFAFLCYTYDRNLDTNKLITDINTVKDQADVIIVSMHNGNEYTENISSSQSNFAHTAIDNGADLVIGHHPHVVQRMEKYNGKYIFYSLGNLIFDQNWSWPTQLGAVIKITWQNDAIKKLEFKPIKIDKNFQPRFMDFAEGKEVLARLQVADYSLSF
ncbi:MAG: CapA family protein [Patescibacteria group bacterium]|jgi:poly-gamma-glutamate synthesis protein (capsule biosynthesis protein)